MASYKSQFSPPARPDAQVLPTQRALSSIRLPTRSITPTLQSQARPLTTSRLQKRKGAKENAQDPSSRNIGSQRPSVTTSSKAERQREPSSKPTPQAPKGNASMGLPRYTLQSSSSRLPKYEGFANTRTPSLVSGSSVSTIESPRSALRRKPSSIGRQAPVARPESMSSQEDLPMLNNANGSYKDPFSETVLGISLPPSGVLSGKDQDRYASERQRYGLDAPPRLTTEDLPPPNPLYTLSATPSTNYSESPTSFSHMSTPTSMSSHSPGIVSTHRPTPKLRQASSLQSRPPVTRRKTEDVYESRDSRALSSVRESSTSSSSVSTVRVIDTALQKENSRNPLHAPISSPPQSSASPKLQDNGFIASPSETRVPQVPPEFAHLADPVQAKSAQVRMPARPSRDGTPDISSLRQKSPIIQSNMASLPALHRRQSSGSSRLGINGTINESASRLAMPTKTPSRNPSPNTNVASSVPRATSRTASSRGPTPDLASDTEKKTAKSKSLTAPTSTKAPSRFGFFTRRTKTEPTPATAPKQDKKLRKGPAAGTGHEGYGRFASRGRSGSVTSGTGSVGRSTSADSDSPSVERTPSSRKSSIASQVDDYFLDRLNPVVIRGTASSTELCRSPTGLGSTPSLESTLDGSITDAGRRPSEPNVSKPTLLPSAMPNSTRSASPMKRFGLGIRRPSESDEEKKSGFHIPTLANRRSSRRSQIFGSKDSGKGQADSSATTYQNSNGAVNHKVALENSSGVKATSATKPMTAAPPKLTRKWNFFQRTQVTSPKKASFSERHEAGAQLPPSRSVAHYALDPADDRMDMEELDQIMKEADDLRKVAATPAKEPQYLQTNRPVPRHVESMLLPSPPALPLSFSQSARPASPQVVLKKENRVEYNFPKARQVQPEPTLSPKALPVDTFRSPEETHSEPPHVSSPPRPSRLVQVGRIPQVVSQRERKLSDHSFSRPFAPEQPRPSTHVPSASVDSVQAPLPAESTIISEAYPAYSGLSTPFNQATFELGGPEDFIRPTVEFLTFAPRRKDSEMSSNSSGFWSFPTPAAVIPLPGAPPGEDEVWGEYDDLIDDVLLSPQRESAGSLLGDSLHKVDSTKEIGNKSAVPAPLKIKASHSASNSLSSNHTTVSVHLRRSRLLSALHAASPKSTLSISDFLAAYSDRHPSVVDSVTGRLSLPSTNRGSTGSGPAKSTRSSLPASVVESQRLSRSSISSDIEKRTSSRYRDSKLMDVAASHNKTGISMADLRFGALMTSKWLSFGRVLFSPVHFDLKDPAEDRVLVIDGLGKDWSYYCALTYSEATVYNLGPTLENTAVPNATPWSSLPNHRHIHHPSMSAPFPFPRGFFAAVVFRFPLVTSESLYRFAVSECKRVLRPGGYLELSVLDIELLNMGNRARRAVRGLKVQMQVAEPGVCLKPASDLVMKLLGRKGFENINRCLVGVPVAAGRMDSWGSESSTDERMDSANSGSGKHTLPSQSKGKGKVSKTLLAAPPPTFTDLLTTPPSPDPQVAATADANITDMVAQVGRWWYSKCYESTIMPESENQAPPSIWADGKLLRECEKRGTGFRLLVAYAQRPNCTVRRTVSV